MLEIYERQAAGDSIIPNLLTGLLDSIPEIVVELTDTLFQQRSIYDQNTEKPLGCYDFDTRIPNTIQKYEYQTQIRLIY